MAAADLIGVVGTVVGTLLGVGIQYVNSRKSAQEASERLFREQALNSKFERLERLHDSLDDCRTQFVRVISQGPGDMDDYSERVREPYDELIDAADKARIYLSQDERDTVDEAVEKYNHARTYLKLWAQTNDPDYHVNPDYFEHRVERDELGDAAEPVFQIIRKKLDPEYKED